MAITTPKRHPVEFGICRIIGKTPLKRPIAPNLGGEIPNFPGTPMCDKSGFSSLFVGDGRNCGLVKYRLPGRDSD